MGKMAVAYKTMDVSIDQNNVRIKITTSTLPKTHEAA